MHKRLWFLFLDRGRYSLISHNVKSDIR
uniref:Uncharacterized protein n=1 Tax=Rhizophora mucronata TaxID=61149 RepID=A0A2P2PDY7_RHIMU